VVAVNPPKLGATDDRQLQTVGDGLLDESSDPIGPATRDGEPSQSKTIASKRRATTGEARIASAARRAVAVMPASDTA
jgi:hypothetical protein